MTIQTQYLPEHYVGDGTTADLAFTWRILAKTDIAVYARDADMVVTTLALDSDFTILDSDVNTNGGGTVTLTVPGTWDTQDIFIDRVTAETQLVNIEEGKAFPAATVIKVFDRLTMMIQELKYLYRQSLHFSVASTFKDVDVPDPVDGTFLGWLDNLLINANIGDTGDEEDVTQDAETFQVTFGSPLGNADYQVISLTPNWTTTATWSNKLTTGFLVTFSTPAPADARLVWRIILA